MYVTFDRAYETSKMDNEHGSRTSCLLAFSSVFICNIANMVDGTCSRAKYETALSAIGCACSSIFVARSRPTLAGLTVQHLVHGGGVEGGRG